MGLTLPMKKCSRCKAETPLDAEDCRRTVNFRVTARCVLILSNGSQGFLNGQMGVLVDPD